MIDKKFSLRKKKKRKTNSNQKNNDQSWYKIKLNQILRYKIKNKIKTKYIAIKRLRVKFDIINK